MAATKLCRPMAGNKTTTPGGVDPEGETHPPIDTVLVWLTNTIERDYAVRGVFPSLRVEHARAVRSAASLHYLTPDEGATVLADAKTRVQAVRKGQLVAFKAHVGNLETAMSEAHARRGMFEASTAVCISHHSRNERWQGTKAGLQARGITLAGLWPQEPGSTKRWTTALDWRGYKANITRASTVWPDLYDAWIKIPSDARERHRGKTEAEEKAELARRKLQSMPADVDAYRRYVVSEIRLDAPLLIDMYLKPAKWHGFTLDEDSLGDVHASFDAVIEAVLRAAVRFDTARHAAIAQGYRADIAAVDGAFQAHVAALVCPNRRVLEGGSQ